MQFTHRTYRALALLALTAGLSCTDATGPDDESRAATDLRLLAAPYSTPPLVTTQVSFYAVKSKPTAADIWYHARPGRTDSLKFLEFRMGPSSLDRRPDGSTIADGDSVLITLTVTDQRHFIVEFQPAGLVFSTNDQATLKLIYAACGEDLNYDGKVDAADDAITQQLSIWRQEAPFQPWFKISSVVNKTAKEVN
ncbi:MAG: hypothetical protein ACJ8AD_03755, partial [Gemmatimonadaceae bacterium]